MGFWRIAALLFGLLSVLPGCGDDDDDAAGDGDADADADGDADADPHVCGDTCEGSTRCIRAQIADFRTGAPVTAEDALVVQAIDPLTGEGVGEGPVDGENGCVTIRDVAATTQALRVVDVTEAEDPADPDRVLRSEQLAGDGLAEGACCDFPFLVLSKADDEAWMAAAGGPAESLEATGAVLGYVVDENGDPVEGATLLNTGSVVATAQYFNDDMTGFVDGADATSASGGFLVVITNPEGELGNYSADDGERTYPTLLVGAGAGVVSIITIAAQ